jgi:hypothetical protein
MTIASCILNVLLTGQGAVGGGCLAVTSTVKPRQGGHGEKKGEGERRKRGRRKLLINYRYCPIHNLSFLFNKQGGKFVFQISNLNSKEYQNLNSRRIQST